MGVEVQTVPLGATVRHQLETGLGDVVFLGQFVQKLLGQDDRSGWKESDVQKLVRLRVGSIQSKVLVVERITVSSTAT